MAKITLKIGEGFKLSTQELRIIIAALKYDREENGDDDGAKRRIENNFKIICPPNKK